MAATIIYLPHGGGPLPLLGDAEHAGLTSFLRELGGILHRPKAILVISAHWEAPVATVTTSATPRLIYDYSGFPDAAYDIQYPAPGNPLLAARISSALTLAV